VSDEKIELLFADRFTTKKRGHGLGLISAHKIVDNHEGQICYHYEQGAVFTVTLPARAVPAEEIPAQFNLSSAPR
jgi:signal transduction histidine kinase